MNQRVRILPSPVDRMVTECDGDRCENRYTLDVPEDVLIGGECPECGYYTTRYQPGMEVI